MKRFEAAVALALALSMSCSSKSPLTDGGAGGGNGGAGGGEAGGAGGGTPIPFAAVSVDSAVTKVKNLLVGLPASDAELAAVRADPTALKGLVDTWAAMPEYQDKLRSFFGIAFQQTQTTTADFTDQSAPFITGNSVYDPQMLENLHESFARTALQLIAEGRPFTETMTTRRFMLTPPLMAYYGLLETVNENDLDKGTNLPLKADPSQSFTVESGQGPIPIEETLDAGSPNYMVFYLPGIPDAGDPNCRADPRVYNKASTTNTNLPGVSGAIYSALFGRLADYVIDAGYKCQSPRQVPSQYFTAADFSAWKMVTIRQPNAGEAVTHFYDLPFLRSSNELVAATPRVGFFTTPAFFAGWQTNSSNQARVTMNQTLIVGLGHAFDAIDSIAPLSLAALEPDHTTPANCFSCHQTLDPMRQFFRQAYSIHFSPQLDPTEVSMPGMFAFDGVSVAGTGIGDLGTQLAAHPRFGPNWVQRLCTYANSAPCSADDPEFQRVAAAFASSNYSWPVLVRELFSSPLITYLSDTKTVDDVGETFPVARRDHLCAALSNRLGLTDVCGLQVTTKVPTALRAAKVIATVLPSDQYSRGAVAPVLANDPSLFFRSGVENICIGIANVVVDAGATSKYKSSASDVAIASFVHDLMGISTDRDTVPLQILHDHQTAALATGVSATDALKSTFVLACLSPSTIGVGQ